MRVHENKRIRGAVTTVPVLTAPFKRGPAPSQGVLLKPFFQQNEKDSEDAKELRRICSSCFFWKICLWLFCFLIEINKLYGNAIKINECKQVLSDLSRGHGICAFARISTALRGSVRWPKKGWEAVSDPNGERQRKR